MQNTRPAGSLQPLLILGAGVLAVHLSLLHWAPRPAWSLRPTPPMTHLLLRPLAVEPAAPAPSRPNPRATRPVPPALTDAMPPAPAQLAHAAPAEPPTPEAVPTVPAADAAPPTEAATLDTPAAAPATPVVPPAPTHLVPGSTRLRYEVVGTVRGLNYSANGELLWRHDGERYEARLEIGAFLLGSRVQTSRGRITAGGLAPQRFSDKVRSEVAAHFDHDKARIIFSANTPEAPLLPGAQDHLSVFIQLAGLFAGQPARHPGGSTLELQAVGAREANLWRFVVEDWQKLQLPGGAQDALRLSRPPARPYDLRAELWLAPALGWLPARIRLTQDNGDVVDLLWRASEAP